MKIGIHFPGNAKEIGGGYTFEQEILFSLCGLAHQCRHELVFIFENAQDEDMIANIAEKGLKIVLLEHPNLFRVAVEREKVELVWFTTPSYVPVDAPYIATVWDIQHRLQPWFPEVSRGGEWEYREAHYSAYLKRAAYIITPNRAGRDELALFYQIPPERFLLLPHPTPHFERLPTEDEVERVLGKYRLQRGYLFYPAQFWAHKNHVNLLLALRELRETFGQEKHLVLVGSDQGNLENVRGRARALGLEEQVHFLGFIPREDLLGLYCGAFALTYVSLFGPENLPPLEAFKCGCPVIAAKVSGALEQYGDAALLVDGLAPEEIARSVIRLEQEASLRQMLIEKGRQRAESYSGMDYVRDVMKVFDDFEKIRRNWGTFSTPAAQISDDQAAVETLKFLLDAEESLKILLDAEDLTTALKQYEDRLTPVLLSLVQRKIKIAQEKGENELAAGLNLLADYITEAIQTRATDMGNVPVTIDQIRNALDLTPDAPNLIVEKGNALLQEGDVEASRREFVKATVLAPNYAPGYAMLGLVLVYLKRYEEAEKALQRALALNPNDKNAQDLLGLVRQETQKNASALAEQDSKPKGFNQMVEQVEKVKKQEFESRMSQAKETLKFLLNADDLLVALRDNETCLDSDVLSLVRRDLETARLNGETDLAEGLGNLAEYIENIISNRAEPVAAAPASSVSLLGEERFATETLSMLLDAEDLPTAIKQHEHRLTPALLSLVQREIKTAQEEGESELAEGLNLLADYITEAIQTRAKAFGNVTETIDQIRDALDLTPDDPQLIVLLGKALIQEGDLESARREFVKATVLAPNFASGHAKLGLVFVYLKRYEEAEKALRRALALQPEDANARALLEDLNSQTKPAPIEPSNVPAPIPAPIRQSIPPSQWVDAQKIATYFQAPAGNTEKHIIVQPLAITHSPLSAYQALRDNEIRDFGKGLEAAGRILEHILLNKLRRPMNIKPDLWMRTLVVQVQCELKSAENGKTFDELKPTQIEDISLAFAQAEEPKRKVDIESYARQVAAGAEIESPLYVSGAVLNAIGARVEANAIYMMDGARRIVASALNHRRHLEIKLLILDVEYARLVRAEAVQAIQQKMASLSWFSNYQSIPLVGLQGERSTKRYDLMDLSLLRDQVVMDFGCNLGQACIQAVLAGAREVWGLEGMRDTWELAEQIRGLIGFDNLYYRQVDFNDERFDEKIDHTCPGLADYTFFFSVYRTKELTQRDRLFSYIISKTRKGIFFEGHAHPKIDTLEYYDWLFESFGLKYEFLDYSEGNLRPLFYLPIHPSTASEPTVPSLKTSLPVHVLPPPAAHLSQKVPVPQRVEAMETRYLVSAIISAYQCEKFIDGRLKDLQQQTLGDRLEIIVVDSGSPENERAIVERYQQSYPNIQYIRTGQRESIYQAWNRGVRMASGKYITNANADDRLRPDALEILANELDRNPDVGLVYGDFFITSFENMEFSNHIRCGYSLKPDYSPDIMLSGCHMGPQPMWRKSIHDEIGLFDESLRYAGDYEFWCRLALRYPMKHISDYLGLYLHNPSGLVNSNLQLSSRETVLVMQMYKDKFPSPTGETPTGYYYKQPVRPGKYVNICMVTYNRLKFTKRAIESILKYTAFPHVLTVVDNGSRDGTPDFLTDLHRLGIIKNLILLPENVGVAKASNLAWHQEPITEYYLKYDNDIVIQKKNWLSDMVEVVDHIPSVGVLAYNFEARTFQGEIVGGYQLVIIREGNVGGACILIPKRTERQLGYWCEEYGLYGEEDADFGCRVKAAGLLNTYMDDQDIGLHLPAGKAAKINPQTLTAQDGLEEKEDAAYRQWKDDQRRKNARNAGLYQQNCQAYQAGQKPLYIESAFVKEWFTRQGRLTPADKNLFSESNSVVNASGQQALLIHKGLSTTTVADTHLGINHHDESAVVRAELYDIIIPVYGQINLVRRCVASMISTAPQAHLILVDDCTPGTEIAALFAEWENHPQITLARTPVNQGFIGACRFGATLGQAPFILFLNSDTEALEPGWLEKMIPQEEDVAIVGAKLLHPPSTPGPMAGKIQHAGVARNDEGIPYHPFLGWDADSPQVNQPRDVNAITGACFLIRRQVWDELGGWDARFGRGVYEDVDLCWQARQKGYRVLYQPAACLYHYSGASEAVGGRHLLYGQNKTNNLEKLLAKWQGVKSDEDIFFGKETVQRWRGARKQINQAAGLLDKRQFSQAFNLIQKAVKTAPDLPEVLIGYAQLLAAQGKHLQAAEQIVKALEVAPAHWDARLRLVDEWIAADNLEKAAEEFIHLQAVFPNEASIQQRAAKLTGYLKKPAQVKPELKTAPVQTVKIKPSPKAAQTLDRLLNADDLPAALIEKEALLDEELLALVRGNAASARTDGNSDLAEGLDDLAAYIAEVIAARQTSPEPTSQSTKTSPAAPKQLPVAPEQPPVAPRPAETLHMLLEADDLAAALKQHKNKLDTSLLNLVRENAGTARTDVNTDLAQGLDNLAEIIAEVIEQRKETPPKLVYPQADDDQTLGVVLKRAQDRDGQVDIVIPIYGQPEYAARCINSILDTVIDAHIILVDDCSPGEGIAQLFDMFKNQPKITLARTLSNQGFDGTTRLGASLGESPFILFLNSDTECIEQGWLENLIPQEEDIAVSGAKLLFPPNAPALIAGRIQHAGVSVRNEGDLIRIVHLFYGLPGDAAEANVPRDVNAVTGACFLVRRRVWDEMGGWDPIFGRGVFEDVDFCWWVRNKGYRVRYQPKSCLYHRESASVSDDGLHSLHFYSRQNMEKLLQKWPKLPFDEDILFGKEKAQRWDLARGEIMQATNFIEQKKTLRAEKILQNAVNLAPDLAQPSLIYANLLSGCGKYKQALEHILHCLEIEPLNWPARILLLQTFIDLGEFDKARTELDQLKPILSKNPTLDNLEQKLTKRRKSAKKTRRKT